jgi:antitoxin component YwqK of YwqJK toxin-antitoxin module
VYREGQYINGKREGLHKEYDENGRLKWESTFKDGKQEGITREYYESGKLRADVNFNDDKQLSMVCYDEQGKIITCPSH